jgi:hypothetical protein
MIGKSHKHLSLLGGMIFLTIESGFAETIPFIFS